MTRDKDIHIELLKLAGFEEDEDIQAFLPDWLMTTERMKLSDEDVRFAAREYIPTYWDIQYRGVRKMLEAYLR